MHLEIIANQEMKRKDLLLGLVNMQYERNDIGVWEKHAEIFSWIFAIAIRFKPCLKKIGAFDALVCTAGEVHFGPLSDFSEEQFYQGIKSKMMGQINLVLCGQNSIRKGGSLTLTSGILSNDPIRAGASASAVNGAIEGFVKSAAIELIDNSVRINVVSPGVVEDSAANYAPFFPGHLPVAMYRVAMGYVKAIEGFSTGKVIEIF